MRHQSIVRLALLLGVISGPSGASAQIPGAQAITIPVQFIPNAGQFRPEIAYAAATRHYAAAFGERVLLTASGGGRVALEFPGGTLRDPKGADPLDGRVHYLVGDPRQWKADLPTFGRVRYEQVYPGIDAEFYVTAGTIEYDFIVAPETDPSAIRLVFRGADGVRLTPAGDLIVSAAGLELRQSRPIVYQNVAGTRRLVDGRYRITTNDVVAFEVGRYDRTRPLIIDPTLTLSTIVGGSGEELVQDVAVDGAGNIYVTGSTSSRDLATAGAWQTAFRPIFVAKLDAAATRLIYATYVEAGMFAANVRALAIDTAGNAWLTGDTISPDFPTTTGAYDRTCGQDGTCDRRPDGGRVSDGFVMKLNATGSALVYSTFIGGRGEDSPRDIGVDAAGRAHIVGVTASADYPVTAGAFVSADPAFSDAFHSTLNASGTALAYSTYLGGSDSDSGLAISVHPDGSRVVLGNTNSPDFPTLLPLKSGDPTSFTDVFVTAFNASGIVRFSTYLGGSLYEFANAIAIAPDDTVYVAGSTYSDDVPALRSYGPYWPRDAWVTRLSADGQRVLYSTRIGGSSYDDAVSIAVDGFGRAFVGVSSGSPDFPTTPDAFQRQPKGDDAILVALNPTGEPAYSTRLGGSGADHVVSLALDGANGAILAGYTHSTDFPIRNGTGWTPTDNSFDSWVARFIFEPFTGDGGNGGNGGGTTEPNEIVLHARRAITAGEWRVVADSGAAGGQAVWHPNANAAKLPAPLATPADYIELTFRADAALEYRIWIRGKADANSWANDSVYAQFSDSVDATGAPLWRIGSPSGAAIQIERCLNCGVQGWGWNDNGWGSSGFDVMGRTVRFAGSGTHTIRLQTREDGLRIDQVVLSAARFIDRAPGGAKNDTTILPESDGAGGGGEVPVCSARELVLHAANATVAGAWQKVADTSAASSVRVTHPNAGAARLPAPLASPVDYVELRFYAEANTPYRFWMRGRAQSSHWSNDSVYVQFSDSVSTSGAPTWRIGTMSATTYSLENCINCAISGWGWNDNEYGGVQLGTPVRFATTGMHTVRIQTREDGLSVDQIVLSAERYFNMPPGSVREDATILGQCAEPVPVTMP